MVQLNEKIKRVLEIIGESDPCLLDHCCRTASLVKKVGTHLGVPTDSLYIAALVHDIGKIFVDPSILSKPGCLTPEERKVVDLHSVMGYVYLRSMAFPEDICEIVLLHHGYQKKKYGNTYHDSIRVFADIVRACDIFDAVTHDRPYHERRSAQEALAIIKELPETIPYSIISALAARSGSVC